MAFELPPLPYDYEALAPFMSKETLEYHHDKHHKAYVDNGNKLAAEAGMSDLSVEEVVKKSFGTNAGLFNNAAQHYNHIHFWKWMKKDGGGNKLPGKLQAAIDSDLGGYDKFRTDFIAAGTTQFGSGWAWLSLKNGKLEISKTPNGENPLVHGGAPILGVVHAPACDATYTAVAGSGARRNGEPIRTSSVRTLADARIAGPKPMLDALARVQPFEAVGKIPSLALRLTRIADATIDAGLISPDARDWDLAAADLVLREAGGRLSGGDGGAVTYNRPAPVHGMLVASAGALATPLLETLAQLHGQPQPR